MSDKPARISASQVTLILQRAAEIDASGDSLTVEELRRIASEAGIDPAATEAAIDEVVGEEPASVPVDDEKTGLPVRKSKVPSAAWIVASGAVGTAVGFITSLPGQIVVSAVGATVLYLIVRAVQSMKRGAELDFQLQNFAVWFGLLIGGSAIPGFRAIELSTIALMFWIVSSVVGGLIVRFGPREEDTEDETPRIGPGRR